MTATNETPAPGDDGEPADGASGSGEAETGPDPAPAIRGAAALLLLLASAQIGFALFQAPLWALLGAADPVWAPPVAAGRGLGVAGVTAGLALALGLVDVVAAAGLLLRRPWGWALGFGASLLRVPSVCGLPAVGIAWLLWRPEVRRATGVWDDASRQPTPSPDDDAPG